MEYKYFYWLYCLILFNHEKKLPYNMSMDGMSVFRKEVKKQILFD